MLLSSKSTHIAQDVLYSYIAYTNRACCHTCRRFLSPEFVPPRQRTKPIKFTIERKDMIRRRKVLNIPEFYVGKSSIQNNDSVLSNCVWYLNCIELFHGAFAFREYPRSDHDRPSCHWKEQPLCGHLYSERWSGARSYVCPAQHYWQSR